MREEALKNLLRECSAYITEKTKEIYSLVPGSGNVEGKIMFISTSPSSKEETTGIFLEGKLGEAFDEMLSEASLTRDDIYMTYAIKYRPYAVSEKTGRIVSREVTDDETVLFSRYLANEIELIKPRLIVTLGEMSYKTVCGVKAQTKDMMGKQSGVTIEDIIYDILPLPLPKEKIFKKVATRQEVITALTGQIERSNMAPTGSFDFAIGDDFTPEPFDNIDPYEDDSIMTGAPSVPSIKYEVVEPFSKKQGVRRRINSSGKRKIIVVYGGSNLADDPTYVVTDRISGVLTELNVTIKRIDLYKNDYSIDAFIDELEESDGVILATTVEWYGIGGHLQMFLDKCFASGRYGAFTGAYLFGIVVSRQSYERDAYSHLIKSWEILGGVESISLLTSIENSADLETDNELLMAIDKKAEDYYRVLNQQRLILPTSIHGNKVLFKLPVKTRVDEGEQMIIKQVVSSETKEQTLENQMSFISNYDEFIEKQQQDIEDISSLFKEKLTTKNDISRKTFPEIFEYKYKPDKTFADCVISWVLNDKGNESFVLEFRGAKLKAKNGKKSDADVVMSCDIDVLSKITDGKLTVQRAFMTGEIKAKGNFTLLYKLDQLFAF